MILRKSAFQSKGISLAGMLSNVDIYNLSKPDIHRRAVATNDDILEAFSGLRIGLRILINPKFFSSSATSTREGEFCASIKKGLPTIANPVYGYRAPAESGAGIGVLQLSTAHNRAKCGFFVCVARLHPSMVGWARASKDAPVSVEAGTPTSFSSPPVIGVFGGDFKHHSTEAAAMLATTPTQNPQFIWLIAAVRRDMPTITAKIHHIAAETEQEARRILARDHVCFFAGRIRLEVAA